MYIHASSVKPPDASWTANPVFNVSKLQLRTWPSFAPVLIHCSFWELKYATNQRTGTTDHNKCPLAEVLLPFNTCCIVGGTRYKVSEISRLRSRKPTSGTSLANHCMPRERPDMLWLVHTASRVCFEPPKCIKNVKFEARCKSLQWYAAYRSVNTTQLVWEY